MNVFRAPEGFLIALTYGRDSEWVKNVLEAGGCELETRGVKHQLFAPSCMTLSETGCRSQKNRRTYSGV